jgi:hypothetical protein
VAVRPQQRRGHLQVLADVDEVVDPIRPPGHRKPAGLVQQQPAAGVQQLIQAPPLQPRVPLPPAEQVMALAEVVADPDRGELDRSIRQGTEIGQTQGSRVAGACAIRDAMHDR